MKLIIVCLLALSALASAVPSGSPKLRAIQRRKPLVGIYGAKLAHIQKYPYTVSTYSDYYAMISGSGTILNHNWILTTNSQLYGLPDTDITIRGGSDDGQTGGQSSKISLVISNYTGDWSEDLALLKTENKLVFNKKLKAVKLAKSMPKADSKAALSGFGKNEIRSGVLAAGQLEISSYTDCKSHYGSDTIFCSDGGEYSPAFDDLGDPLVQKKQLVGIYNGYDEVGPYTFMGIANFRDWIIQTIKENSEGDEADGIDDDDDFGAQENDDDDDDEDDSDDEDESDEDDDEDESDDEDDSESDSDSDEDDSDE